jgi:PHP domain-containing protein
MRDTVREELRGRGLLDVVESANGGPFTAVANARALAWARASGVPHTASSDAHEAAMIGTCLVSAPAGPVDAASLPALLRAAAPVDRRPSAATALAVKAAGRVGTALRVAAGREPMRRRCG